MKYYFTFGQKYPALRNRYVEIEADYDHARKKVMNSIIGTRFAFQYDEDGFGNQAQEYGLSRISLSNVTKSMFAEQGDTDDAN